MNIREVIECSAIVVYYEEPENLKKCLASIKRYCPRNTEIIVVNNAPSACEISLDGEEQIRIIDHRCNVGFGRGVNLGLQSAKGDYILLLNPDAELTDDFVNESIHLLEAKPFIAAVGPKLIDPFGRQQSSAQRFPTCPSLFLESFKLECFRNERGCGLGGFKFRGRDYRFADWLSGAAIVLKREVLKNIGGFDSRYFMYYEDIDLFHQLNKKGYYTVYCEDFIVKHISRDEGDFYCKKYNSRERIVNNVKSLLAYWDKNDRSKLAIVRGIIVVNYILRILVWLVLPLIKPEVGFRSAQQRVRGYVQSIGLAIMR